jgi:hypothetical protein
VAVTERGVIQDVNLATLGAYLAVDAAGAATSLVVDSGIDFDELGGTLTISGADYTYVTVDFDTNPDTDTITGLSPALPGTVLAGTRVDVAPVTVELKAKLLPEHAGDTVSALVPHGLMDRVPEGIRAPGLGEVVLYEKIADQFVITDLRGREPVIDGAFIDPATLPPPASDGLPPASSPLLTALGNVGAIHYRWTPIANSDPYQFKLHIDTTPGFTPGPGNLVVVTAGSSFTYVPAPLDYTATYYARLIQFDEDGDASPSAEVSAQLRQADSQDISAAYAYLGQVLVDQLVSGTLNADVALAGLFSTRGGGTAGGGDWDALSLRFYDALGVLGTLIGPDQSKFKGDAELNDVTVTGGIGLRSAMNEVSRGAQLHLRQGTTAPQSAPAVVVGWPDPVVVDAFAGNYGLVWTGSEWATLSVLAGGGTQVVERSSSGDVTLDSFSNQYAWGGFTRIGTDWYTLEYNSVLTNWWITKYNSSGVFQTDSLYSPIAGDFGSGGNPAAGLAPAAIGTDGTNLLVAEFDDANNRYRIQTRSASTLSVTSTMNTGANAGFTGPVVGVKRGNFDFGSERTVILTKNGLHFYTFDNTGAYVVNDTWAVPVAGSMSGFDWDGTRFWSTRAKYLAGNPWIYKHTTYKWSGADPLTHHATSTWRDTDATGGTHETDMGPPISFSMKKRAAVTLTSPLIPDAGGTDDPNAVAFYLSNTTAARTSMWRQTLPADGVPTLVAGDGIVFSGTNPPSSNNFPGATPGQIDNLPLTSVLIKGDGTGNWDGEGWTSATLNTSWSNVAGTARYRKDPVGTVYVQGSVSSPSPVTNATVLTLPAGYRPSQNLDFALKANADGGTVAWIRINTTGAIAILGNNAQAGVRLELNALIFSTR